MEGDQNHVENPSTALASESESEAPKPTPTRRKKLKKKFEPNFDIPGVYKLVLPEEVQSEIGCITGETVTTEKPWAQVDKETIHEHLEAHVESSVFLPIKKAIMEFQGNEILMGYIPDESKDYDEFYICVTEEATNKVNDIVEKLKVIQAERLQNAVHRRIKKWKSLGSDKEIDEGSIKYNRSLIEVEIESKYPILPFKVQFKLTSAQDLRDGYMELRPTDDAVSTIFKRRIDANTQVAPSVVSNEAQTVCTYPKNSYTQYEYNVPELSTEASGKYLKDFLPGNMDSFCDILKVNGCIDLYSNDYENLVLQESCSVKVVVLTPQEYRCFIDKNLCAGKMISSTAWHPMWTGCIVASYVDMAPNLYLDTKITTDEVFKAVHDTHPVLFWSFNNDLKPKLILETPRPIYTLSCCPYDPNIILGGCVNGQIVLWDITNKLTSVEEEEILTVNQHKYRAHMFTLMKWMKNIFDIANVRPTVVSDLKYSPRGCINYISWMSPFHSVSKTGKIEEIEEGGDHSLQFVTSSEDGTVQFWDLLKKPVATPGGFKSSRKLKRLKKKPSALLTSESHFRILHLNLRPIYKINVGSNRPVGISSAYVNFFNTLYTQTTHISRRNIRLSDRVIFEPVIKFASSDPRKMFYVGTMDGSFIQAAWEGQAFDSGEVVNFEECTYLNHGKYHDGPIVSIDYSTINDTILTVGGKIFALWRPDFKNRPLIWRKSSSIYTAGAWYKFEQASLRLIRMDGHSEIWTLFHQSKSPLSVVLMSNGMVNIVNTHDRKIKHNVVALTDYRGSLRLFCVTRTSPLIVRAKEELMSEFLTEELTRKKQFLEWQKQWNQRHVTTVEATEEETEVKITETVQSKVKVKEEKKKIAQISPGMRYLEMVKEQHRRNERERIQSIILMKKQLNTEDLLKKRQPLRKLEEENEVKKRRQRHKMRESDKIFKDQVAMLFPDVVKIKPPPPPDPYEDLYGDERKQGNYNNYHGIAADAKDYVEQHPFDLEFGWGNTLRTGRERRRKLDDSVDKNNHGVRFGKIREEKLRQIRVAEEAAKLAAQEVSAT